MSHPLKLLAGPFGAALVALSAGSAAACTLQMVGEFKVDLSRGVPIVDGEVDGMKTRILIDTGAATTTITAAEAANLGLTTVASTGGYVFGGAGQTYSTVLKSLKIGSLSATDMPPMTVGGDATADPDIGLVVGEDLLRQFDVELDLADNDIRLFQPDGCTAPQLVYWNKPYSQAALAPGNAIETEVSFNGRRVLAALDTDAATSRIDPVVAAGAGVGALTIGDENIAHARVQLTDAERGAPPMLIGEDFLHAHRVMVDYKDHLMVFSYNGGPIFSTGLAPGR